ncbi:hypothetical protein QQ045_025590 [Rhodiola kirilowii]
MISDSGGDARFFRNGGGGVGGADFHRIDQRSWCALTVKEYYGYRGYYNGLLKDRVLGDSGSSNRGVCGGSHEEFHKEKTECF